jgi:hypothetical protein
MTNIYSEISHFTIWRTTPKSSRFTDFDRPVRLFDTEQPYVIEMGRRANRATHTCGG